MIANFLPDNNKEYDFKDSLEFCLEEKAMMLTAGDLILEMFKHNPRYLSLQYSRTSGIYFSENGKFYLAGNDSYEDEGENLSVVYSEMAHRLGLHRRLTLSKSNPIVKGAIQRARDEKRVCELIPEYKGVMRFGYVLNSGENRPYQLSILRAILGQEQSQTLLEKVDSEKSLLCIFLLNAFSKKIKGLIQERVLLSPAIVHRHPLPETTSMNKFSSFNTIDFSQTFGFFAGEPLFYNKFE